LAGEVEASIDSVTPVNASTYDVAVSVGPGRGQLRLDLHTTDSDIADLAGNPAPDGTFTDGEFYLVGIESVFDTFALATNLSIQIVDSTHGVAQRFTTASVIPLTLTSVALLVGAVNAPEPVVRIFRY